jgi:hypothetical protein
LSKLRSVDYTACGLGLFTAILSPLNYSPKSFPCDCFADGLFAAIHFTTIVLPPFISP